MAAEQRTFETCSFPLGKKNPLRAALFGHSRDGGRAGCGPRPAARWRAGAVPCAAGCSRRGAGAARLRREADEGWPRGGHRGHQRRSGSGVPAGAPLAARGLGTGPLNCSPPRGGGPAGAERPRPSGDDAAQFSIQRPRVSGLRAVRIPCGGALTFAARLRRTRDAARGVGPGARGRGLGRPGAGLAHRRRRSSHRPACPPGVPARSRSLRGRSTPSRS